MSDIKNELQEKSNVNIKSKVFYNTKWDDKKFADLIIATIKKVTKNAPSCPSNAKFFNNEKYWNTRRHITYTVPVGKKPNDINNLQIDSNEVFLERVISYRKYLDDINSIPPTFWNQFQVGKSPKEDVDIRIEENNKIKYVELKVLNKKRTADNPLFAIIESIKNYYLTKNEEDRKNITELIVLAPDDYWEQLHNIEAVKSLKPLVNELKKIIKTDISLKKINFNSDDLREIDKIFREYIMENKNNFQKINIIEKTYTEERRQNKRAIPYDFVINNIKLEDVFSEKHLCKNNCINNLLKWTDL